MTTPKLTRYGSFNTWDAAKLLALLLMFIDHAGYFFFPDQVMWRAFGRGAAPIFLFLTGYAPAHRIKPDLILMAALMWLVNIKAGGGALPLGILGTIIIGRCMTGLLDAGKLQLRRPYEWMAALTMFFPIALLFAYGAPAMMLALCGYMQRHEERYARPVRLHCLLYTFLFYGTLEYAALPFTAISAAALVLTLAGVAALLWRLRTKPVALPPALARFEPGLRLAARYSLWIYALHFGALQLLTGKHF